MKSGRQKKGRIFFIVLPVVLVVAAAAGTVAFLASQYTPRVQSGVTVAGVDYSGKTRSQAAKSLENWWAIEASRPISLVSPVLHVPPEGWTPERLGCRLDVSMTVSKLPFDSFWQNMEQKFSKAKLPPVVIPPVIVSTGDELRELAKAVKPIRTKLRPASLKYAAGIITRGYEEDVFALDVAALQTALPEAILSGSEVRLPMRSAPKHIPDEALDKIAVVMSEVSTNFSTGKVSRCHNIQLATRLLNGSILMPGQRFSFNRFLGKRTIEKGFQEAGVYKDGKHDVDVGGGICQVSTTLYNAVLRANLKVISRSPHTYPVPYVPFGQDAAVSFPEPDFSFINTTPHAIALSTEYKPGRITFRVLGAQKGAETYRFVHREVRSWTYPIKYVFDPDLKPGRERVVDRGGRGHEVLSWRVAIVNGKEVRRDKLGMSTYNGGPRIVARGKPKRVVPAAEVPDKPES